MDCCKATQRGEVWAGRWSSDAVERGVRTASLLWPNQDGDPGEQQVWRGCQDLASRPASPQHLLLSFLSPNWPPLSLLQQSVAAPVRSPVQPHGGAESSFSLIFSEVFGLFLASLCSVYTVFRISPWASPAPAPAPAPAAQTAYGSGAPDSTCPGDKPAPAEG